MAGKQRVLVSGYLVREEPIGLTPDVLSLRVGDLEDVALQLVEDGDAWEPTWSNYHPDGTPK
jgi:hypothetical protein